MAGLYKILVIGALAGGMLMPGQAMAQDIFVKKNKSASQERSYMGPGSDRGADQQGQEKKSAPIYIKPQTGKNPRSVQRQQATPGNTYYRTDSNPKVARQASRQVARTQPRDTLTSPPSDITRVDLARAQEENTQAALRMADENQARSDAKLAAARTRLDQSVEAYKKKKEAEKAKKGLTPGGASNVSMNSNSKPPLSKVPPADSYPGMDGDGPDTGGPDDDGETAQEQPKIIYKSKSKGEKPKRIFNVFE